MVFFVVAYRLCRFLGHDWCNIIYSFSLFYGLLSGLGSLLGVFCFLCFMSAVSYKLYYTKDEPYFLTRQISIC